MPQHTNHGTAVLTTGGPTGNHYAFGFTGSVGRRLIVIGGGAVLWSNVDVAWTLVDSNVPSTGNYVWTKVSDGTETEFVADHNGNGNANFAQTMEVFEYPVGTPAPTVSHATRVNNSTAFPSASGLSGGSFSAILQGNLSKGTNTVARTGTISVGTLITQIDTNANSDGNATWTSYLDGNTGTTFAAASQTSTTSVADGNLFLIIVPDAPIVSGVDFLFENDWGNGRAGDTPTAANSPKTPYDAITSTTFASGATMVYDNTWTHNNHGNTLKLNFPSGASGYAVCTLRSASATNVRIVTRGYYRVPVGQTIAALRVLELRNTGGTLIGSLEISSTGKWAFFDSTSTAQNTGVTPVAGTEYRIELALTVGTSTSNSIMEVAIYTGDSMTPIETPLLVTGLNCGTTALTTIRLGASSTSGQAQFLNYGPVRVEEKATGYVGPFTVKNGPRFYIAGSSGPIYGGLFIKNSDGSESPVSSLYIAPITIVGHTNGTAEATNATTHTITLPTGISAGDLIVVAAGIASSTVATASGGPFTGTAANSLIDTAQSGVGGHIWTAIAAGTESGATVTITTVSTLKISAVSVVLRAQGMTLSAGTATSTHGATASTMTGPTYQQAINQVTLQFLHMGIGTTTVNTVTPPTNETVTEFIASGGTTGRSGMAVAMNPGPNATGGNVWGTDLTTTWVASALPVILSR